MKSETRKIIRESARLCKESYTNDLIFDGFHYIRNEDTGLDCFIKKEEDITWIVFRGTETDQMNDVCSDLMTFRERPTFFPDRCRVHAGFLAQYASARSSITEYADYMDSPKVVCTGHSLGGGLATLCALDIEQNSIRDIETYCVTFGSPRVGGKHFVNLFDACIDNSYRFVDVNDPIPRVPFGMWGFHHVKGCYTTCPQYGFRPDIDMTESSSLACCAVEDHGIEMYEAALRFGQ